MHGRSLAATLAVLITVALPSAASAATFTVSNTNDSGAGSFRQAILDANAAAGRDGIAFGVGLGGAITISLASDLPTVTEAVVIDGESQDGTGTIAQPVTLDGNQHAGLTFAGSGGTDAATGSQVLGFRITDFKTVVLRAATAYLLIQDSVIDANNATVIVDFQSDASGAVGAGPSGSGGNRISGNNGSAIGVTATPGTVLVGNNTIGLDAGGLAAANAGFGIVNADAQTQIFGNVVSASAASGIFEAACAAVLTGNRIGTNAAGTADRGNGGAGVSRPPTAASSAAATPATATSSRATAATASTRAAPTW